MPFEDDDWDDDYDEGDDYDEDDYDGEDDGWVEPARYRETLRGEPGQWPEQLRLICENGFHDNVDYAFIDSNKYAHVWAGEPCFGAIQSNNEDMAGASYFWSWAHHNSDIESRRDEDGEWSEEYGYRYIDFVLNRSVFADAFITKNASQVTRNGVLMTTALPSRAVISAATCIRYTKEYPYIPHSWDEMVRNGVDEQLAFVFSHFVQESYYKNGAFFEINDASDQHIWCNAFTLRPDAVKRLITNDRTYWDGVEPMSASPRYDGLLDLWKTDDDLSRGCAYIDAKASIKLPKLNRTEVAEDSFGREISTIGVVASDLKWASEEFVKLNNL